MTTDLSIKHPAIFFYKLIISRTFLIRLKLIPLLLPVFFAIILYLLYSATGRNDIRRKDIAPQMLMRKYSHKKVETLLRVAVAPEQPEPQRDTDRQDYVCFVSFYFIFDFLDI